MRSAIPENEPELGILHTAHGASSAIATRTESAISSLTLLSKGNAASQLLVTASTRDPPLCALILVECLVTEDAPNGLICMG
jgi:hypothetical protein